MGKQNIILILPGEDLTVQGFGHLSNSRIAKLVGEPFTVHMLSDKVALVFNTEDEEAAPNCVVPVGDESFDLFGPAVICQYDGSQFAGLTDSQCKHWLDVADEWEEPDDEDGETVVPEGWAAVMFSPEGEVQFAIPDMDEDAPVPPHVHIATAIAIRLQKDEAWAQELSDWMDKFVQSEGDKE